MAQNTVTHTGLFYKGDDAHARAASAQEGISLENLLNQPRPRAAGFPGEIRIVLVGIICCRGGGALATRRGHWNAGAVGVCSVKPLAMASRARDMKGEAVDPLERVECDGGCAGSWIGRRIHNQVAVIESSERIQRHSRPGDIPGLRFQRGGSRPFDRGAGID
jgi:hypothetical protein